MNVYRCLTLISMFWYNSVNILRLNDTYFCFWMFYHLLPIQMNITPISVINAHGRYCEMIIQLKQVVKQWMKYIVAQNIVNRHHIDCLCFMIVLMENSKWWQKTEKSEKLSYIRQESRFYVMTQWNNILERRFLSKATKLRFKIYPQHRLAFWSASLTHQQASQNMWFLMDILHWCRP